MERAREVSGPGRGPRNLRSVGRVAALVLLPLCACLAGYVARPFVAPSTPLMLTGFADKTLWDWMELLIVPAALAIAALVFTKRQTETELLLAERRAVTDRQLAADRTQEEALHAFLDRITQLILEHKLGRTKPDSSLQAIAEARTLTTLRRLSPERQGLAIRFLSASHLLTVPQGGAEGIIRLVGSDLSGITLQGAWLLGADLGETVLRGAELQQTVLKGAMLFGADLSLADLRRAVLQNARLDTAKLVDANLEGAFLQGANVALADFTRANVAGADFTNANMLGTNFTGSNITREQLNAAADIRGVTMPDGSKLP